MLFHLALLCLLVAATRFQLPPDPMVAALAGLAAWLFVRALAQPRAPAATGGYRGLSSHRDQFSESQLERLYPAHAVRFCRLERGGIVLFICLPDGRIASRFMPPARRAFA